MCLSKSIFIVCEASQTLHVNNSPQTPRALKCTRHLDDGSYHRPQRNKQNAESYRQLQILDVGSVLSRIVFCKVCFILQHLKRQNYKHAPDVLPCTTKVRSWMYLMLEHLVQPPKPIAAWANRTSRSSYIRCAEAMDEAMSLWMTWPEEPVLGGSDHHFPKLLRNCFFSYLRVRGGLRKFITYDPINENVP